MLVKHYSYGADVEHQLAAGLVVAPLLVNCCVLLYEAAQRRHSLARQPGRLQWLLLLQVPGMMVNLLIFSTAHAPAWLLTLTAAATLAKVVQAMLAALNKIVLVRGSTTLFVVRFTEIFAFVACLMLSRYLFNRWPWIQGVLFLLSAVPLLLMVKATTPVYDNLYEEFMADEDGLKPPLFALSFNWFYPVLKLGHDKQLHVDDMPLLPMEISSSFWHGYMTRELRPGHRDLWSILRKLFGSEFGWLGLLKLGSVVMGFGGPMLLSALVTFVDSEDTGSPKFGNIRQAAFLVIVLVVCTALSAILSTQYNYRVHLLQIKVRMALTTIVFDTALKVKEDDWNKMGMDSAEIVNMLAVDVQKIVDTAFGYHDLWALPLQVAITFALLYSQVSYAFVGGVALVTVMVPINMVIATRISVATKHLMEHKDARVAVCSDAFFGIKSVKMQALERAVLSASESARNKELKHLGVRKYLDAICVFLWATTPVLVPFLTFVTCLYITDQPSPAQIFTTVALLNMLIFPMNAFPWVLNGVMEARVSANRIWKLLGRFLVDPDATDAGRTRSATIPGFLGVQDLVVGWSRRPQDKDGKRTRSTGSVDTTSRASLARESMSNAGEPEDPDDVELSLAANLPGYAFSVGPFSLEARHGAVIGCCGQIGSGKSSLLLGMLGELHIISGRVHIRGGMAYAPQAPVLLNRSIRENIIGKSAYAKERYKSVLKGCSLDKDLASFPAGDLTVAGDRGSKLSGGQRLRVAIAAAFYSRNGTILLDDPFSALDSETAARLMQFVQSEARRDRIIVIATHHVRHLAEADLIFVLANGKVVAHGTFPELQESNELFQSMLTEEPDAAAARESEDHTLAESEDASAAEESKEVGQVHRKVYLAYFEAIGGLLMAIILLSLAGMQASANGFGMWLSYWAEEELSREEFVESATPIVVCDLIFTAIRSVAFAYGGLVAAKHMYNRLIKSVLGTSLSFFETTPVGRIINRFSKDTDSIDDSLPFWFNILLAQIFGMAGTTVVLCIVSPALLPLLVMVGLVYFFLQDFYRASSREIRRIDSVTRSPVFSLLSDAVNCAPVIRADRAEEYFTCELYDMFDTNQRTVFAEHAAKEWLNLRMQALGGIVTVAIAIIGVVCHIYDFYPLSPGMFGLALAYGLPIVANMNGLLNAITETEKEMISVERVLDYSSLPPEEADTGVDHSIPTWCHDGSVVFENVTMSYRPELPPALDGVSFSVAPGDRVAIMGRTGAGKSSLGRVLLRLNAYEGNIRVAGIDIRHLPLQQLRSAVATIPQDPLLFSGSLWYNLDPFGTAPPTKVLQVASVCRLQLLFGQSLPDGRLVLEDLKKFRVEGRGRNLSVGQRQLICLARAMIKSSLVYFVDEATASIDTATESALKQALLDHLTEPHMRDKATLLMICHRKETATGLCTKLLVMEDGEVESFTALEGAK